MDFTRWLWNLAEEKGVIFMKKSLVLILSFVLLLTMPACASANQKMEQDITNTLTAYFEAFKNHDVEGINKYRLEENRYREQDEIDLFVNTVLDCKLLSVDFKNMITKDNGDLVVSVNYFLEYDENAVPAGSRQIGENDIREFFTLRKQEDNSYIIVHTIVDGGYGWSEE